MVTRLGGESWLCFSPDARSAGPIWHYVGRITRSGTSGNRITWDIAQLTTAPRGDQQAWVRLWVLYKTMPLVGEGAAQIEVATAASPLIGSTYIT